MIDPTIGTKEDEGTGQRYKLGYCSGDIRWRFYTELKYVNGDTSYDGWMVESRYYELSREKVKTEGD